MATVYRAYEPGLDRYIALKVLPDDSLDNETAVQRFKLEARAVARLVHPNIVPVHAFGIEEATRAPWMALQLIEGGSLASLLAQGRLAPRRAVGFLRGIASALDYAHAQGVLHRDVKPQNVLIAAGDHVYLADFGLARILESSAVLSASGTVLGTPQYMAPEQALGQELDHRCDIYALGIVAYELFAGAPPFQADTPLAVLMKHVREPIPIPAPERVAEPLLRPVLKALAKDRADRWPTALSFVEALNGGVAPAWAEQPTEPVAGGASVLRPTAPAAARPSADAVVPSRPPTRGGARPSVAETSSPAAAERRSRAVLIAFAAVALVIAASAAILLLRPIEPIPAVVPPTTVAPTTLPPPPTAAPAATLSARAASPSPEATPSPGVIQVRSSAAGASVTVDDTNPKPLPAELHLDAGKHMLEVTKAGCQSARQWLQVAAGEQRRVDIDLACPTPAPPDAGAGTRGGRLEGTLALVNGARWRPAASGESCVQLDGVDDFVAVDAAPALLNAPTRPYAIQADVELSLVPRDYKFIVDGLADDQSGLRLTPGGYPVFKWVTSAGSFNAESGTPLTVGVIHRVRGEWDGALGRLFVDDRLVAQSSGSGLGRPWRIVKVGDVSAGGTGTGFFPGCIGRIAVYPISRP